MSTLQCVMVQMRRYHPKANTNNICIGWRRRLATSSSSATTTAAEESRRPDGVVSNRRKFREIEIHPGILQYIQTIGVGIPPRQAKNRKLRRRTLAGDDRLPARTQSSRRGRPNQEDGSLNLRNLTPPLPFGPNSLPVKIKGRSRDPIFPTNRHGAPQVAFCGRSNVGKSTLLNSLVYGNRILESLAEENEQGGKKRGKTPSSVKLTKGIKAITSPKPGETREITFYELAAPTASSTSSDEILQKSLLWLVDLPGYGFAHANEEDAANYKRLISSYLLDKNNRHLRRVLMLIDARHGMKRSDMEFLGMLQNTEYEEDEDGARRLAGKLPPVQLVLTKCDLVPQIDLARRVVQVREQLSDALIREPSRLPIMLVSARAGVGFNNLDKRNNNRPRGGILELQKELASLTTITQPNEVYQAGTKQHRKQPVGNRLAMKAKVAPLRNATTITQLKEINQAGMKQHRKQPVGNRLARKATGAPLRNPNKKVGHRKK